MNQPSVMDILWAAKQLLIEHGWFQGQEDEGRANCPATAIWRVSAAGTAPFVQSIAVSKLCKIVKGPIAVWNDAAGRTFGEVLAAFDQAIEAAKHDQKIPDRGRARREHDFHVRRQLQWEAEMEEAKHDD